MAGKPIALVTAGARTIGAATTEVLAAEGMSVCVADVDWPGAQAQAARLPGAGHRAVRMDALDECSVIRAFAEIEEDLGPVQVLVSCVGGPVTLTSQQGFVGLSVDDWDRTYALNARGQFLVLREMLRRRKMQPVPDGRIVTVSSLGGQVAWNPTGAHYTSSKAAVIALTKFAAVEAAVLGITVNTVAPGAIDGPGFRAALSDEVISDLVRATPLQRLGTAEDVATAVAWLVSKDAGYITGATIDINGGRRMA